MFEEVEAKMNCFRGDEFKILMEHSILHIARIVHPISATSIATDARIIITDTRSELKEWIEDNRERFLHQRQLFSDFLDRIQSLKKRVDKINQME